MSVEVVKEYLKEFLTLSLQQSLVKNHREFFF